MTLGQCLDEIRKIFLNGDVEAMAKLGVVLLKKLKHEYYLTSTYPRSGWFIFINEGVPYLANSEVQVEIEFSRAKESAKKLRPVRLNQKNEFPVVH